MSNNKTKADKDSLPAPGGTETEYVKTDYVELAKLTISKINVYHVMIGIGIFAVFLGYISVAPPTDLPNWPLYTLNAKTWQSFERWGQHVKPYHIRLMTTALQHIESRALYIITYLNVPDILDQSDHPMSCEEIKQATDQTGPESVNLPYLCRVLHAAAHFDLLAETSDDKYMLTPLSEYLTSSHPKSLKGFVKLYSGDEAFIISTALSRSIYSGQSGFKETYRTELLDHLKLDPLFQDEYDAGTADGSRLHAPAIIADYPSFSSCKHICDIGGGLGSFLHAVLQYYSYNIKGTNFDLPDVIKNSELYFRSNNITDEMINLVPGNFSEEMPKLDCDCYILKDVLENWSDDDAALILSNIHKIVGQNGRLLLMERVMHTGSASEERFKALLDLMMMSFNPSHSRLRTVDELYFLLEGSGFADPQLMQTRAGYNIIEVYPEY